MHDEPSDRYIEGLMDGEIERIRALLKDNRRATNGPDHSDLSDEQIERFEQRLRELS